MPLNKVIKLFVVEPENISSFALVGNAVSIELISGASWNEIQLLPKPILNSKPDITEEGNIINHQFKAGVKSAPANGFYVALMEFADGSKQICGTLDFPVHIVSDYNYSDFAELTLAFKWKYDAILNYVEA